MGRLSDNQSLSTKSSTRAFFNNRGIVDER